MGSTENLTKNLFELKDELNKTYLYAWQTAMGPPRVISS